MAADVPDGAAAYRENHLYAVDEALFRLWPVTDIFAGAGKPERGIFCTAGRMGEMIKRVSNRAGITGCDF